jgi:hypothetical protein
MVDQSCLFLPTRTGIQVVVSGSQLRAIVLFQMRADENFIADKVKKHENGCKCLFTYSVATCD